MEKRLIMRNVRWRWGWILLCLLLSCGLTAFGRENGEASPALTVRREGEDLWSLWVTPRPYGLTAGDPGALLLCVEAPEGWLIGEITEGYGAEGMTLTHGELPAEEVRILLDGAASKEADGAILWVRMKKNHENPPKQGGYVGVTGGEGDPVTLFVLRENGYTEKIDVTVRMDTGGWSEDTDIASDEETTAEPMRPPAESAPPLQEDPIPTPLPSVFLGCRETAVTEGSFAAQFLFRGERGYTPVICMEGGGALSATSGTVQTGGEAWSACTFYGLRGDRTYVFFVGTDTGWVRVTYENGAFVGISENFS